MTVTITVPPTDGTTLTTQDDTRFQAVAYDPVVGTNDGDGIQQVDFNVYDPSGKLIYANNELRAAYCAFGGDGPCNPGGQDPNAPTGTYTLRARAQSTGGTWTDWVVRTFVIGDPPTPVPTDTPVPTATEPPATPPILFTSDRDGNHEIYAMNADGSSQTRLTNNTAMDIYPAWFLDHSRVVFASTRDGSGLDVYTMLPDGSSVTRLTTSSGDDYGGSASPDGTRIAFVSSRDGDLEIFVMNADGSGPDFTVNAGWGHFGSGSAVMPGRGRLTISDSAYDVYLNESTYWRGVPVEVWEYTLGGYQVLKKWLSYRETAVLGRPLKPEEAREFMHIARRIAALLALNDALDGNYEVCV